MKGKMGRWKGNEVGNCSILKMQDKKPLHTRNAQKNAQKMHFFTFRIYTRIRSKIKLFRYFT